MATIYGDNAILDDIRTELKAQMDTLLAAMVAVGTSPRPAAVYDTHEQVKMSLPAISVGTGDVETSGQHAGRSAGVGSAIAETYVVHASLRVHVSYRGGALDTVKQTQIMNSASNWLETHRGLNVTGFCRTELEHMKVNQEFAESLTVGAEIGLLIVLSLSHTQA